MFGISGTYFHMLLQGLRYTSFALIGAAIVYLALFYFGVFQNKSISEIHQRVSTGYSLMAIGFLGIALDFKVEELKVKWVKDLLEFFGNNQYIGYCIAAGILLLMALIQYRKSLKAE